MKRSTLLIILAIAAISAMVYFSISSGPTPEEYAAVINEERVRKDEFMKSGAESPLKEKGDSIRPLNYFPPDLKYRIMAKLEPITNKQVRLLITNTGEQTRYLEYAWAIFELDGKENKLKIMEIMDMGPNRGKLFLAFADETSAKETYGGGRYLDLKKIPAASSIELDFNNAYNPYCAYNHRYSCPLPPQENLLTVAIRAGEKDYK